MANEPHHDDKSQNPEGAKKDAAPPKPTIPNMEIDKPIEPALEVEEVFEEGVPIVEAAPASDVAAFVLSDEDVVAEEVVEAAPASKPVEQAMPMEALAAAAAPASEVFEAEEVVEEAVPVFEVVEAEEVVEEAAPASEVFEAEEVVEEAAPASEVFAAEEVVEEAAPASEVFAAEEVVAEAAPASEVFAAEEIASGIIVAHEPIHSAPVSEVIVAADPVHSAPASEVVASNEEVHSGPHSEVAVAHASAVVAAEDVEEVVEAMPESAVVAAEEAEEIAEAAPASGVLYDEEIAEASPASEAVSAELAEEVAEAVDDTSSATRKAEAVLGDEVEAVEVASGAAVDDATEMAEAMPESAVEAGSSAVLFDEDLAAGSAVAESGRTKADTPISAAEKADSGVLSAQEEFGEATEISSTVEAQSDRELAKTVPSVEFDELLDEVEGASAAKKKHGGMDESTETDAIAIADEADAYGEAASGKKKAKPVATGDDIDLDELFGDEQAEEAAEAMDAEAEPAEAAEAEAAEVFDEEMEAAAALGDEDDEPTKKKGKKSSMKDEDDDLAAVADQDDDTSAKKKGKKSKKDKEKATVAPQAAQSSAFLRVLIGMVLAGVILVGGAAAGLFVAPNEVHKLADMVDPAQTNQAKADRAKLTSLDKKIADVSKERDTATKELADAKKKLDDAKGATEKLAQAIADKDAVTTERDAAKKDLAAAEKKLDGAANVLVKADLLKNKAEFSDAKLGDIIKGLGDDRKALADVNAMLKKADIKGINGNGVKEVLEIKKGLEDNIAAVERILADEKTKSKGDKGVLEIVDARNKLAKDRDALLDTMTQAFKEFVDGKIVAADADPRKEIVAAAKVARQKAESPLSIPLAQLGMSVGNIGVGTSKMVEQAFNTAKLVTELTWYKSREEFIETPQQKMNTYVALLQDRNQKDAKRLADISREADWVRTPESRSNNADQAKARFVQALALRNQEKFAEAKSAFADTVKMSAGIDAGWTEDVRKSQRELTDPNEYYLPKMRKLLAAGDANAALSEANTALQAIPENARLHAERGLIRIELIRGKGPKIPEQAQEAIKSDAQAAAKDAKFMAESTYIVGLLDEEMAHWPEAEEQFRKAIKLHEDSSAPSNEGGKYRVALARILLRDRTEAADVPVPNPNDNGKNDKKKDAKDGASVVPVERTIVMHPWSLLVAASVVAQPIEDPEDPAATARYKEAVEQAKKLIESDDKDLKGAGYLALGKALSKMGKRTEGLKAYAKGMRLIHPDLSTKDLKDLIDQHPAFQQPDPADTPNPLMAERHFGEGIHLYWSRKYPEAEAQFRQAVRYFDKDARYQYFLGLSQLQQKTLTKRDHADFAFQTGAKLEAKAAQSNPDAVREINASLERVQGELRQHLNGYRYKAMTPELEEKK